VGESVFNPYKYYQNNLISFLNLLEMIQNYEIENLIFSSSCTVYGNVKDFPITEKTPLDINTPSPYGKTKQMCESFLQDIAKTNSKLNTQILRYFNPMGAHESGLLGELPLGEPHTLMPYITQTAIGKRKILKVFGNDYDTKDGTCERDFFHITDLVNAHIVTLKRLLEKQNETNIEIFNFGSGKSNSVLSMIDSFEKVNQVKVNFEFAPRRDGDVAKSYADCSKAKEVLNWQPTKTIDDITKSAWAWEKYLKNR
jgi:UDP-glucose 4-epimerase